MIRVLIADDHAIVRGGLKQIFSLSSDFAVVSEASNGKEVLQHLQSEAFDLLLLDLNMEGIISIDLIVRVRARLPQLAILILSMHDEPQVALRALKAGANGYVTKDCEPIVLLDAARKVAAGGRFISPDLAQRMVFDGTSVAQQPLHHLLSDRESEVLRLLVAGKSVNDIATQLAISNKTVSTHKLRMMEKLQLAGMAELMRYALDHGLLV